MSTIRDHLHDLRVHIASGRVHVSNAWYRAAGHRIQGVRGRLHNARVVRAQQRGRRDLPRRAADSLRSSLLVYRDRINPSTGRPNRDSRQIGRGLDESLTRRKPLNARINAAEAALERQRQEPARARQYAQGRAPGRPCRPGYYCHHNYPGQTPRDRSR
jgi:hypothetical protein